MLSNDTVADLEVAVEACNEARSDLVAALEAADSHDAPTDDPSVMQAVGDALEDWRNAQQQFMAAVKASSVSDVATASLLLKKNHGIDATNGRRGLPGLPVEGTDQPFDLDVTGTRGQILTQAAMEYVS